MLAVINKFFNTCKEEFEYIYNSNTPFLYYYVTKQHILFIIIFLNVAVSMLTFIYRKYEQHKQEIIYVSVFCISIILLIPLVFFYSLAYIFFILVYLPKIKGYHVPQDIKNTTIKYIYICLFYIFVIYMYSKFSILLFWLIYWELIF